ncbi:MAG: hypothetical protein ACLQU2_03225 [Candidatus Binataceae bacterium]
MSNIPGPPYKPIKKHAELKRIREWAQSKIDTGAEPPFAWYQYMKLIEAADAILRGFSIVVPINKRRK